MIKVLLGIVTLLVLFAATGVEAKTSPGVMGGILLESEQSQEGPNQRGENGTPQEIPELPTESSNRSGRRRSSYKQQVGKYIVLSIRKTIDHFYPDLYDRIRSIKDCRKKKNYELLEIIMAAILMFILKRGSRNSLNNIRKEKQLRKNYKKIFNLRMPHMDSVNNVMRKLPEEYLENLKMDMVKRLIENKIFHKLRLFGKYHMIAIDATHIMNVPEGHCEHCLYTTSKKGKKRYFHNVLEAMLVGNNGFSISLGTEWIENPDGAYEKQDCEQKAFARLAIRLKRDFKRLPVCIIADGLYPNQTFFNICKNNGWKWIVTFKDGNLSTVWKEVIYRQEANADNNRSTTTNCTKKEIVHVYTWINNIQYHGHILNWFECIETIGNDTTRFVYVSSLTVDNDSIIEITESGRMRWKIENEGFNILKNNGYGLRHKYSRTSMQATKNYYQCMLIGHLLNQLLELSPIVQSLLNNNTTIKHLWEQIVACMSYHDIDEQEIKEFIDTRRQFRYG